MGTRSIAPRLEPRAETLDGPDFDPLALAIYGGPPAGHGRARLGQHAPGVGARRLRRRARSTSGERAPRVARRAAYLAARAHRRRSAGPRFVDALRRYADRKAGERWKASTPVRRIPEVRERVLAVWMDLLNRYDLDGIHFDYIRFPSSDFDYSRGAFSASRSWVSRSCERPGRRTAGAVHSDPLAFATALPTEWDEFRRAQITSLVSEIYTEVKVASARGGGVRRRGRRSRRPPTEHRLPGLALVAGRGIPRHRGADGLYAGQRHASAPGRVGAGSGWTPRRTWAGIGAYINRSTGRCTRSTSPARGRRRLRAVLLRLGGETGSARPTSPSSSGSPGAVPRGSRVSDLVPDDRLPAQLAGSARAAALRRPSATQIGSP